LSFDGDKTSMLFFWVNFLCFKLTFLSHIMVETPPETVIFFFCYFQHFCHWGRHCILELRYRLQPYKKIIYEFSIFLRLLFFNKRKISTVTILVIPPKKSKAYYFKIMPTFWNRNWSKKIFLTKNSASYIGLGPFSY
jgi:hypothetical protein